MRQRNRPSPKETAAGRAFVFDEVGIESAFFGPFLLKSARQPIYRLEGDRLSPFAAEALIRTFRDGKPVSPADFFAWVPDHDRLNAERMCRALHLRNYHNNGVEGIELFYNFGSHAHGSLHIALQHMDHMAQRLDEIGIETRHLVCEITELEAFDRSVLVQLAARVRSFGIRLAIDDFGAGHSTIERVEILDPDFIKIDGGLFRRMAASPVARQLMGQLVNSIRDRGCEVVIEGIETGCQLAAAVEAGATHFQGYLLARPELVGTIFPEESIPLARYIPDDDNVVRLFG